MIGSLIGAGMSVGGALIGGMAAAKAAKRAKKNIEQQRKKNEDWYNRRYNEDATQRADAQAVLTQTQDLLKRKNRQSAGTAAVMGGTMESVAADKAAATQTLADATTNIAVNAGARKDNIESTYMSNDNAFVNQLNEIEMGKASAIQQAGAQVGAAGASIASGLDGIQPKKS